MTHNNPGNYPDPMPPMGEPIPPPQVILPKGREVNKPPMPSITELQQGLFLSYGEAKRVRDYFSVHIRAAKETAIQTERERCIKRLLKLVPMTDPDLTTEYLREELAK